MRVPAWLTCAVLAITQSACTPQPASPLDHEAYIWQRQWTPAIATSLDAMRGDFNGWRVLAAESTTAGELVDASPRLDLLARGAKPVIAVLRLNGSRPPPSADRIAQRVEKVVEAWRAAGVSVSGIEIDHDCATARLDAYADLLASLRTHLPAGLKLSITALPTWIGVPVLARVLAQVDASVLQVHAITAPRMGAGESGLFDPAQAQRWIDAYAGAAHQPFRVALPAYGLRVGFGDDGAAITVEGEMPRAIEAEHARELRADPVAVSELLQALARAHPASFAGIVWFRLPSEDDRRAWSIATLHAVIAGTELKSDFGVRTQAAIDGAADIVLANRGTLDASPPAVIEVAGKECAAADALDGFRVEKSAAGWRFFSTTDAILRAGHERRIGWARCTSIDRDSVNEHP